MKQEKIYTQREMELACKLSHDDGYDVGYAAGEVVGYEKGKATWEWCD